MCPYCIGNSNAVYYPPIKHYAVYISNLLTMNFLNVAIHLIYHMHKPNVFSKLSAGEKCLSGVEKGLKKKVTIWYCYDSIYRAYSCSTIFL